MPRTVVTRTLRIRQVRRVSGTEVRTPVVVPCIGCGRDVTGVTPVEAIRLLQSLEESLGDLLGQGIVHAIPTAAGTTWICRDSLFRRPS